MAAAVEALRTDLRKTMKTVSTSSGTLEKMKSITHMPQAPSPYVMAASEQMVSCRWFNGGVGKNEPCLRRPSTTTQQTHTVRRVMPIYLP